MKFRGHETFSIRRNWLSKGMTAVKKDPAAFVTRERNPMDTLGMGANMVKSLRYWLQAVGLTEEPRSGRRVQSLTELGALVWQHDRYLEERGTLFLLQYRLATNEALATSWYFFFNLFRPQEFDREDFVTALSAWLALKGEQVAARSLYDDFACLVNTYLPRQGDEDPESNLGCPLAELGLLSAAGRARQTYRRTSPGWVPPWVLVAVLMEQAGERREIPLQEILLGERGPGCVFALDAAALLDGLHEAERTGCLRIVRTAGLDVVRLEARPSFAECVAHYYEELENG